MPVFSNKQQYKKNKHLCFFSFKTVLLTSFLLLFASLSPNQILAAEVSWIADTGSWSTPANWSTGEVPTASDDVLIDSSVTVNLTAPTTVQSLTLGNSGSTTSPTLNFSYDAITTGALNIDGGDLHTYSGSNITHSSANLGSIVGRIKIIVTSGTTTIDGTINTNSRGYKSGLAEGDNGYGPGGGIGWWVAYQSGNAGGAGHGARGQSKHSSGGPSYQTLREPTDLGSAGGRGGRYPGTAEPAGSGGGNIYIYSSSDVNIAGTLSAIGGNGGAYSGGGSGGSIYIHGDNINITGTLSTLWGSGNGTGSGQGAGGRILIEHTGTLSNTGSITSGTGTYAGTAYIYDKTNNNITVPSDNGIWYSSDRDSWSFENFYADAKVTLQSSTTTDFFTLQIANNLILGENTTLAASGYYTDNTNGVGVFFDVGNSIIIPSTSKISGDALGYRGGTSASGSGTGHGVGSANHGYIDKPGGGGGYGGAGGRGYVNSGSLSYGDRYLPLDLGSGGGYGRSYLRPNTSGKNGGSAIKIETGTLNIEGTLSANGGNATEIAGGGSGGGLLIYCDTLEGSGNIEAKGGGGGSGASYSSRYGGNGGGGRIAIYYQESTFDGSMSVVAGTTGTGGSAGTLELIPQPLSPYNMMQKNSSDEEVEAGGLLRNDNIFLTLNAAHAASTALLTVNLEIQEVGTAFEDIATHTFENLEYNGTALDIEFDISGLDDTTSYHWQAQVCDGDDVCTGWVSYGNNTEDDADFTTHFNTDPDGPISLSATGITNGSWTNNPNPTLSFYISDPDLLEDIKYQIQIDNNSDFSSPIVDYTSDYAKEGTRTFIVGQLALGGTYTTGDFGTSLPEDSYYWRVKAIDSKDAESSYTQANGGAIAFKVDTTAPTGAISFNPEATSTTSANIQVNFIAADSTSGLKDLMICQNNSFSNCTWESYTTTKNYTLNSPDGTKNVYVKFRDNAGNVSTIYTMSIILDRSGPTGSIRINNGASSTTSINATLFLSSTDETSSVQEMRICTNQSFTGCSWEQYRTQKAYTLTGGNGQKSIYVQYRDSLGLTSEVYSSSIFLNIPPVIEEEPEDEEVIVVEEIPELEEEEKTEVKKIIAETESSRIINNEEGVSLKVGNIEIKTNEQPTISVYKNTNLQLALPVDLLGEIKPEDGEDIDKVYAVLGEEVTRLNKDPLTNKYVGLLRTPNTKGTSDIEILTIFKNGDTHKQTLGISIDPYGYVYSTDRNGNQLRIKDAIVSLYKIVNNKEQLYISDNQSNPQQTNSEGEYSFLVEPGSYILKVEADGYEDYTSSTFEVTNNIIEMNIKLERSFNILDFSPYLIGILLTIPIYYVFLRGKKPQ